VPWHRALNLSDVERLILLQPSSVAAYVSSSLGRSSENLRTVAADFPQASPPFGDFLEFFGLSSASSQCDHLDCSFSAPGDLLDLLRTFGSGQGDYSKDVTPRVRFRMAGGRCWILGARSRVLVVLSLETTGTRRRCTAPALILGSRYQPVLHTGAGAPLAGRWVQIL